MNEDTDAPVTDIIFVKDMDECPEGYKMVRLPVKHADWAKLCSGYVPYGTYTASPADWVTYEVRTAEEQNIKDLFFTDELKIIYFLL
jgi:hypothetical protein